MLGAFFLHLIVGPLSDKYGRRKLLITGGFLYLLGSLGCILSPSLNLFLLSRVLQGLAISTTIVGATAAINEYYHDHHAVRAMAIASNVTMLAPALGPLFGSLVLELFPGQWRLIFVFNGIIGLVAWCFLVIYMPETLPKEQFHQGSIFRLFRHLPNLAKNKVFMLYSCSLSMATFIVLLWLTSGPVIFMQNFGFDERKYAYSSMPFFGVIILANFISPSLAKKYGVLPILKKVHIIMFFIATLIIIISYIFIASPWILVGAMMCFSLFSSLIYPLKTRYTVSLSEHKGTASGAINQIIGFGPLFGSLLAAYMGQYPIFYTFVAITVLVLCLATLSVSADTLIRKNSVTPKNYNPVKTS